MLPNVEIVIGTYEEFLLGYKLSIKDEKQVLAQSFADKSHSGGLKCVAVQGRWIATGATDDRIFIYDMRTRKQSQILLCHEGTINALAFTPDETHLLSGGDDGRMIATRINTWITEATWKKAHNGATVTHISCHPSGKLALSLGGDLVLRTWNLVKGRVAYKTNLKSRTALGSAPDCLAWSPTGDYFTLTGPRTVEIWSIKNADVAHSQKTTSKPISVCWVTDEACLVGMENGQIQWVQLNDEAAEKESITEAHTSRVKCLCYSKGALVTASSSGEVKLWEVQENKRKLKEIAAVNIGCRPTCLGLLDLEQFGEDYALNNKVVEEKPTTSIKNKKPKQSKERGVVTIEYEEDETAKNEIPDDEEENSDSNVSEQEQDDDSNESDENESEPTPKAQKRKQQQDIKRTKSSAKQAKLQLTKQVKNKQKQKS